MVTPVNRFGDEIVARLEDVEQRVRVVVIAFLPVRPHVVPVKRPQEPCVRVAADEAGHEAVVDAHVSERLLEIVPLNQLVEGAECQALYLIDPERNRARTTSLALRPISAIRIADP